MLAADRFASSDDSQCWKYKTPHWRGLLSRRYNYHCLFSTSISKRNSVSSIKPKFLNYANCNRIHCVRYPLRRGLLRRAPNVPQANQRKVPNGLHFPDPKGHRLLDKDEKEKETETTPAPPTIRSLRLETIYKILIPYTLYPPGINFSNTPSGSYTFFTFFKNRTFSLP